MVTRINCRVQFSELWQSRKPKWSYFKTSKFCANEVCKGFVHIPQIKELSNHRNLDGIRREGVISPSHAFITTSYLNEEGEGEWAQVGMEGGTGVIWQVFENPWKRGKQEQHFVFFFFIKINLGFSFFFFLLFPHCDSLAAWVCLHCPHFRLQMLGLCKKKKSSCFWSNQQTDCYSCDVISNFPPANWLTKQECGLKDKESRNRDIKLDFFTKQGPQKYTQLLQVSCSLTQISTVFSAL